MSFPFSSFQEVREATPSGGEGLAALESQVSSGSLALGTGTATCTQANGAASSQHREHCRKEMGRTEPEPASSQSSDVAVTRLGNLRAMRWHQGAGQVSDKEIHLFLRLREGESFPEGHMVMERKGQTFQKDSGSASLETDTGGNKHRTPQ